MRDVECLIQGELMMRRNAAFVYLRREIMIA